MYSVKYQLVECFCFLDDKLKKKQNGERSPLRGPSLPEPGTARVGYQHAGKNHNIFFQNYL